MLHDRRVWVLAAGVILAMSISGCQRNRDGSLRSDGEVQTEQARLDEASTKASEGEYSDALEIFHAILEDNPTSGEAYLGIGDVYLEQKDYVKAEPALARAAKLEPRSYQAQFQHGLALQMLDRFLEAVQAYHRALTIDPDSAEANRNLAMSYLRMDEPRNAMPFADRAIQLDPTAGDGWVTLGAAYEGMQNWSEAAAAYIAASERMEPTPELMRNLLRVLIELKRYREVISTAQTLQRFGPDADAFERSGWAAFRLGEYSDSLDYYRKSVEIDPEFWQAWNGIGVNRLNAWLLSNREDSSAFRDSGEAFRSSLRINGDQTKVISLVLKYQL
ncbi:MAG: hypothetical protein CMJ40_03700 [Phycisphaerae bacterium]|nr:hypothetical protein [Phycisphaerae bacterium]|tara:strand:- start:1668 stop:2663 length:996 start_codon:yes stop_codon:yes gene_type:complete